MTTDIEGDPPPEYAILLKAHLDAGTRPPGDKRQGERWQTQELADAVGMSRQSVDNWVSGTKAPQSYQSSLLNALFGATLDEHPDAEALRLAIANAPDRRRRRGKRQPSSSPERNARIVEPPPEPLIGRVKDIAAVRAAVLVGEGSQCVLVHGPAGVGKTALTEAVASDPAVVERFGEANRSSVSLETVRSGDQLADAVANAIGTAAGPGIAELAELLNRTGGLLVLDNLETPFDAAPRETEAALAALAKADQLAVLASFRGATRVAAPWVLVHTVPVLVEPHDKALFCRVSQNAWEGDEALPSFLEALGGCRSPSSWSPTALSENRRSHVCGGTGSASASGWRTVTMATTGGILFPYPLACRSIPAA